MLVGLTIALTLLLAASANADETFTRFDANITIDEHGTASVTEYWRFHSEGALARDGLLRIIPLVDELGQATASVEAVSAALDGEPVSIVSEMAPDGSARIRVGAPMVSPPAGELLYEVRYIVRGAVIDARIEDEFAWEVTGFHWPVGIHYASAAVTLPKGAAEKLRQRRAFSGGAKRPRPGVRAFADERGVQRFLTAVPLLKNEGVAIDLTWEKGLVTHTASARQAGGARHKDAFDFRLDAAQAHGIRLVVLVWSLVLLIAHGIPLIRIPRRMPPAPGLPEGVSPALASLIWRRSATGRALAAAMIGLVREGVLKAWPAHVLTLERSPGRELSLEEEHLTQFLEFRGRRIELDNPETVDALKQRFLERLESAAGAGYFRIGGLRILSTALLSMALVVVLLITRTPGAFLLTALLGGLTAVSLRTLVTPTREGSRLLAVLSAHREFLRSNGGISGAAAAVALELDDQWPGWQSLSEEERGLIQLLGTDW